MTAHRWAFKRTLISKKQGEVWVVEAQDGTRGYFKHTTPKQYIYAGPMVANEYISAALAKRLRFPVAELETATVTGPDGIDRKGIVSVAVAAADVRPWCEANPALFKNPEMYVKNSDRLAALLVFDVWIANLDRGLGENLILYRNSPSEKYDWYLIDHGHCLHGSPLKWKRGAYHKPIWERVSAFRHTPKGLRPLQRTWSKLKPMIAAIESLTEADINTALGSVPAGYLTRREHTFIRRLLLYRQKRLRQMIHKWMSEI